MIDYKPYVGPRSQKNTKHLIMKSLFKLMVKM